MELEELAGLSPRAVGKRIGSGSICFLTAEVGGVCLGVMGGRVGGDWPTVKNGERVGLRGCATPSLEGDRRSRDLTSNSIWVGSGVAAKSLGGIDGRSPGDGRVR
jgi:hypothetical protein